LIRAQYMFEYIPQLHAHARAHGPRPRGRHASPLSGRTSCDVSIPFANIEKQKERERERERKAFDLVSRFNWQTYVYTYIYTQTDPCLRTFRTSTRALLYTLNTNYMYIQPYIYTSKHTRRLHGRAQIICYHHVRPRPCSAKHHHVRPRRIDLIDALSV
jgi:hypothetical protein